MASDADDVAHVHRLSRAWYYGTEPDFDDGREAMWSHLIAQPGRLFYVAESGGSMVGFMSAIRTAEPAPRLELTSLYVLPDHAALGIGSRLHDVFEAERRPDEEGVLEVWEANARAVAFYTRRGWVRTLTTRPGPQETDFVIYRLPP